MFLYLQICVPVPNLSGFKCLAVFYGIKVNKFKLNVNEVNGSYSLKNHTFIDLM